MRRRVPLRKSLLVRLLAASILVAVCSVAATAWLAVNTTSQEIQQERVQTLSDDAGSYETLLGYAATHHDWDGVGPVLADLTKRTGRHIALTTQSRQPIGTPVDSGGAAAPHASPVPSNVSPVPSNVSAVPSNVSAVIDPLDVDQTLAPAAAPPGSIRAPSGRSPSPPMNSPTCARRPAGPPTACARADSPPRPAPTPAADRT